jgi:dephospho-CoA kinase
VPEPALHGVLRLDHVGSTAVPRLAAKDRIDVQLTTPSLEEARGWIEPLERAGFKHEPLLSTDRSPEDPWERAKLFFHRSESRPHVNLHVRELQRGNWVYALLFRDYLRVMPVQAAAYAEVKTRLAELVDGRRSPYSYVKEPACDLIFNAALAWAETVGWKASDYEEPNVDEFVTSSSESE